MQFNGHTLMLLLSATVARCNFEHQQSPAAAATEIKGSFYLLSAYSFKVLRLYEIHSSNCGRYYYVITASDLIEFSLFFSYYQPVSSVLRLSFYAFLVQSNHSTQLPHAMVTSTNRLPFVAFRLQSDRVTTIRVPSTKTL